VVKYLGGIAPTELDCAHDGSVGGTWGSTTGDRASHEIDLAIPKLEDIIAHVHGACGGAPLDSTGGFGLARLIARAGALVHTKELDLTKQLRLIESFLTDVTNQARTKRRTPRAASIDLLGAVKRAEDRLQTLRIDHRVEKQTDKRIAEHAGTSAAGGEDGVSPGKTRSEKRKESRKRKLERDGPAIAAGAGGPATTGGATGGPAPTGQRPGATGTPVPAPTKKVENDDLDAIMVYVATIPDGSIGNLVKGTESLAALFEEAQRNGGRTPGQQACAFATFLPPCINSKCGRCPNRFIPPEGLAKAMIPKAKGKLLEDLKARGW
jgi:hypothetical protein